MVGMVAMTTIFSSTECRAQATIPLGELQDDAWGIPGGRAYSDAVPYYRFFDRAIKNPGVPILIEEGSPRIRLRFPYKQQRVKENRFIVFNEDSGEISLISKEEIKERNSFILGFILVPIITTILANYCYAKKRKGKKCRYKDDEVDNLFFVSVLSIFGLMIYLLIKGSTAFIPLALAVVVATSSDSISENMRNEKTDIHLYRANIIVFYLLMVMSILYLFV